jgi:hypothetical protein
VDRIEALGRDAVVVGAYGQDLHFSSIALGDAPAVAAGYRRPGATRGEEHPRLADPRAGSSGVRAPVPELDVSRLPPQRRAAALGLGELVSHPAQAADDGCRASCVDWYGNARPLFLADRILALLGYEIVEGRLWNGRIEELRRVSFAPAAARAKD